MVCLTVTELDLSFIHIQYNSVLRILNEEKCSLAQAMDSYGVARNTIQDFITICELKIMDKEKYKAITKLEKDGTEKPSVRTIEKRCRAALLEYKAQSIKYKEEGKLLPFFPSESFYAH